MDEMRITAEDFRAARKIDFAACGTSWHAGQAGKFMIESRRAFLLKSTPQRMAVIATRSWLTGTITVLASQSGETADTIAAQREAKTRGSKTLAICNVVGSMIPREADGTIYTHVGAEVGVASTKTFTAQLTALYLALYLAQLRGSLTPQQAGASSLQLWRMIRIARCGALNGFASTTPRQSQPPGPPISRLVAVTVHMHRY
jgi:glutamine---fructose-6-phosphate transaminase (isomerizing)